MEPQKVELTIELKAQHVQQAQECAEQKVNAAQQEERKANLGDVFEYLRLFKAAEDFRKETPGLDYILENIFVRDKARYLTWLQVETT